MKLVTENSEADLQKSRLLQGIQWPLKQLSANIIRVTRGAGRAYELRGQMVKVLEALEEYRDAYGHYPSDNEISDALNISSVNSDRLHDGISGATDIMVKGALQIAASKMLGQPAQEAAGECQLFRGKEYLDEAREEIIKRRIGSPAEKAEIAEQDKIFEEMDRRAANYSLKNPRMK